MKKMKFKVYLKHEKSEFGKIREFDDDASKFYREPTDHYSSVECREILISNAKEIFDLSDGDGDETGCWGSSVILVTMMDEGVIFDIDCVGDASLDFITENASKQIDELIDQEGEDEQQKTP